MCRKKLTHSLLIVIVSIFFEFQYVSCLFVEPMLKSHLNSISSPADLPVFYEDVVLDHTYNDSSLVDCPSTTVSIYTTIKYFYDIRMSQNFAYMQTLDAMLSTAKTKYFLNSTQKTMVSSWSVVSKSEVQLYNNFAQLVQNSNTPQLFLTNIASQEAYNRTCYQVFNLFDYINNFYTNRWNNIVSNLNYFQQLLDLLNACTSKQFLTDVQRANITSWIFSVTSNISSLNQIQTGFQNLLTKYYDSPSNLNSYLINSAGYNQSYLQNYPTPDSSVYAVLKNLFNNRESRFVLNNAYLTDLQTLLNNAKSKYFLTTQQQADVSSWYNTVTSDLTLISNFKSAFSSATTVAALTTLVQNAAYDRVYFQNFPYATYCIYTKIQSFSYQILTTLTAANDFKILLDVVLNKTFLTTTQKMNIISWQTSVTSTIAVLSDPSTQIKANFTTAINAATTIEQLITIIITPTYNQTYLQNYPTVSNSIYYKIQNFFNQMTNATVSLASLQLLKTLLTNALNKNFLTTLQNLDISSWLAIITDKINVLTVKTNFANDLNSAITVDQLNAVVNNVTYNQTYLQNYPDATTNNIYIKIENLAAQRTQNLSVLTQILGLLNAALGKNFLTTIQNGVISSLIQTINAEIQTLSSATAPKTTTTTTTTPAVTTTVPTTTVTTPVVAVATKPPTSTTTSATSTTATITAPKTTTTTTAAAAPDSTTEPATAATTTAAEIHATRPVAPGSAPSATAATSKKPGIFVAGQMGQKSKEYKIPDQFKSPSIVKKAPISQEQSSKTRKEEVPGVSVR